MKIAWLILAISALTNLINAFGGALIASMIEGGSGELPGRGALLIAIITGLMAFARTIQETLKTTPATIAELKGQPVQVTTTTADTIVQSASKPEAMPAAVHIPPGGTDVPKA